jgi:hypothetical protein
LDPKAKQEMDSLRQVIGSYLREETMIDHWMHQLSKTPTRANNLSMDDIVKALYYPVDAEPIGKEALVDETGKPRRTLMAIHAPFSTVVQIPALEYELQPSHQLFIGSKDVMVKLTGDGTARSNKKRKLAYEGRMGTRTTRSSNSIQVFLLSTYFDDSIQKVAAAEVKAMAGETKERSASWDLAESLANDEGVSDFLATGEEEAV